MNPFVKLWRTLRRSGFSSIYKTVKVRLKSHFISKAHIVLMHKNGFPNIPLMKGVTYKRHVCLSEIPGKNIQQICKAIGEERTKRMFLLFDQGAIFWAISVEQNIVGYWWSISGHSLEQWYISLNDDDAVFFSAMLFPEWRGYSISPAVLMQIIKYEMPNDISIYLDVETWNDPARKAWIKAGFVELGTYPSLNGPESTDRTG